MQCVDKEDLHSQNESKDEWIFITKDGLFYSPSVFHPKEVRTAWLFSPVTSSEAHNISKLISYLSFVLLLSPSIILQVFFLLPMLLVGFFLKAHSGAFFRWKLCDMTAYHKKQWKVLGLYSVPQMDQEVTKGDLQREMVIICHADP